MMHVAFPQLKVKYWMGLPSKNIQKYPKTTWAHGTLGFFSPMDAVQLEGFLL